MKTLYYHDLNMKKHLFVFVLSFTLTIGCSAFASCGSNDTLYDELPSNNVVDVNDTTLTKDSSIVDATQLMQNATVISSYDYTYAFGISQMVIIGNRAYVNYGANKNKLDDDAVNNNNEFCCSEVNLHDMSVNTLTPKVASKKYADGSDAPANSIIGYQTYTPTINDQIATFALMRFNNNNPFYCYSFVNPSEQIYNYTTCKLEYLDKEGHEHYVDYTINNYRQMLVDLGFVDEFTASANDAYDNINLHYNKETSMYYAVVSTSSSKSTFPIIFMQSTDMYQWSPCSNIGGMYGANEISAVVKDGKINICYRTYKNGMRWLIYDITNKRILSEGRFDECRNVLSKPDTFFFDKDIYMAVNVYPSVYGNQLNLSPSTVRQEINIYKIVNNKPEFFRKVYNPDGINYFSFCESQNGRIYMAFSEDRRHLYKRLFSNVSFADVTEIFYN